MIFRYTQEVHTPNGSTERRTTDFQQSELIFGRGGESHVILSSTRVGTVHAKFSWDGNALIVSDLGSVSGTRVNGSRVARCALKNGDRIDIGDVEITVLITPNGVELVNSISPSTPAAEEKTTAQAVAELRIDAYLPRIAVISSIIVILGLTIFFVVPLSSSQKRAWTSGPISNAHKLIEADCKKCHATPFVRVQDKECLACHNLTEHAKGIENFSSKHANLSLRCAECHMEHNGDNALISRDERFCTSCHATMSSLKKDATVENVASFDKHPQFRISVSDAAGIVRKVSLDDTAQAIDSSRIKLNHKLHLKKGLQGSDGPVTLECNACHRLNSDFKTIQPISFDTHCRDCHSLGFDERLPYTEVPHGDAEAVYPALFAAYTKVILLHEDDSLPNPARDMVRSAPDGIQATTTISGSSVDDVVTSAREAERQLFTKTACFLCHSFSEKPEAKQTKINSHYEIVDPKIPSVWFTAARFSHGAHEEFTCESCHDKTRSSTETTDLLLPGKKLCQECHSSAKKEGFVRSDCVECHSYHDALGFPLEKKQDIAAYIRDLTR
jgi:hypothetical protein